MKAFHTFPPAYDKGSRILILGSFPSVKSREAGFYYHHPQNRFWKVLGAIYNEAEPKDIPTRRSFLAKHKIALWDVIAMCDISGSADSKIRNITPNDLSSFLNETGIHSIFCNGTLAYRLYCNYAKASKSTLPMATLLPSTSPANATYSLTRLYEAWQIIFTV